MNPEQKTNQPDTPNSDDLLAELLKGHASPEQQEAALQQVIEREAAALRDALHPHEQQREQGNFYQSQPEQQQQEQQRKTPAPPKSAPTLPVYEPRDMREDADESRGVLVDEFIAFVIETRHKVEMRVWSLTRLLRELQPFLEARIDESEREVDLERPTTDPHRQRVLVAPVVYEYGVAAAALGQVQSHLDLLNSYYFEARENRSEFYLEVTPATQRDVRQLWEWFLDEREADQDDAEEAA